MGTSAANNSNETLRLIGLARAGDRQALSALLERHRDRLRRMVELRLDWRLQARIDASDILQDAFLEVATRLDEYLRSPELPLFLWLRLVVGQRLATVHRHHLGTKMRDAGRQTSPSQAAVRAERVVRLQEALNTLDPVDREVLALRHFEQLTAAETARVLDISEEAAAKRYIRALKRLKQILAGMPGGLEGL